MTEYEMAEGSMLRIAIENNIFVEIWSRGKIIDVEVYREKTVIEKIPVPAASVLAFGGARYISGSPTPTLDDAQAGRTRRHPMGQYPDEGG